MRLTETRFRILSCIARGERLKWAPMCAREIAIACGEGGRASDWANGPLREMAWHGLVEPAGITSSGARTWRLTLPGRERLAQGIEAGTGETPLGGSIAEGDESPTPRSGDAPEERV